MLWRKRLPSEPTTASTCDLLHSLTALLCGSASGRIDSQICKYRLSTLPSREATITLWWHEFEADPLRWCLWTSNVHALECREKAYGGRQQHLSIVSQRIHKPNEHKEPCGNSHCRLEYQAEGWRVKFAPSVIQSFQLSLRMLSCRQAKG